MRQALATYREQVEGLLRDTLGMLLEPAPAANDKAGAPVVAQQLPPPPPPQQQQQPSPRQHQVSTPETITSSI